MRSLVRRLALAPLVLIAVAAVTYGMPRVLRPDLYAGEHVVSGLRDDLRGIFLHFDLKRACGWPGCPSIHDMWLRGMALDLWLLGGALAWGIVGGVLGGMFCAARPRALLARLLENFATLAYCTPVYVMGLGLLLLFNPSFGLIPLPAFFDANPSWASPLGHPWQWFRSLLVPWLIVGAPIAGMCLRITASAIRENLSEDYVRTALAKGLARGKVVSRHAGPPSHVATASFIGVSVPLMVMNVVLIERVLSVPGFFRYTWKALGHTEPPTIDYPMLQAITLWAAVLIIGVGLLSDALVAVLDPRIRPGRRRSA